MSMILLMSVLVQYSMLKQRGHPLLMSVQHLLMGSYLSLIDSKLITCVRHNSDLAKERLQICLYTYEGRQVSLHFK